MFNELLIIILCIIIVLVIYNCNIGYHIISGSAEEESSNSEIICLYGPIGFHKNKELGRYTKNIIDCHEISDELKTQDLNNEKHDSFDKILNDKIKLKQNTANCIIILMDEKHKIYGKHSDYIIKPNDDDNIEEWYRNTMERNFTGLNNNASKVINIFRNTDIDKIYDQISLISNINIISYEKYIEDYKNKAKGKKQITFGELELLL